MAREGRPPSHRLSSGRACSSILPCLTRRKQRPAPPPVASQTTTGSGWLRAWRQATILPPPRGTTVAPAYARSRHHPPSRSVHKSCTTPQRTIEEKMTAYLQQKHGPSRLQQRIIAAAAAAAAARAKGEGWRSHEGEDEGGCCGRSGDGRERPRRSGASRHPTSRGRGNSSGGSGRAREHVVKHRNSSLERDPNIRRGSIAIQGSLIHHPFVCHDCFPFDIVAMRGSGMLSVTRAFQPPRPCLQASCLLSSQRASLMLPS